MTTIPRMPLRCVDDAGRHVVAVPLADNAGEAFIDTEDFDRLVALGLSTSWYLNGGTGGPKYVRAATSATGSNIGIARSIMEARAGEIVRYRDGDTKNLRRSNLLVRRGTSKRTDSDVIARTCGDPRQVPPSPPRVTPRDPLADLMAKAQRNIAPDPEGGNHWTGLKALRGF